MDVRGVGHVARNIVLYIVIHKRAIVLRGPKTIMTRSAVGVKKAFQNLSTVEEDIQDIVRRGGKLSGPSVSEAGLR